MMTGQSIVKMPIRLVISNPPFLPDEKFLFAGIVAVTDFESGLRLTRNDHSAEATEKNKNL